MVRLLDICVIAVFLGIAFEAADALQITPSLASSQQQQQQQQHKQQKSPKQTTAISYADDRFSDGLSAVDAHHHHRRNIRTGSKHNMPPSPYFFADWARPKQQYLSLLQQSPLPQCRIARVERAAHVGWNLVTLRDKPRKNLRVTRVQFGEMLECPWPKDPVQGNPRIVNSDSGKEEDLDAPTALHFQQQDNLKDLIMQPKPLETVDQSRAESHNPVRVVVASPHDKPIQKVESMAMPVLDSTTPQEEEDMVSDLPEPVVVTSGDTKAAELSPSSVLPLSSEKKKSTTTKDNNPTVKEATAMKSSTSKLKPDPVLSVPKSVVVNFEKSNHRQVVPKETKKKDNDPHPTVKEARATESSISKPIPDPVVSVPKSSTTDVEKSNQRRQVVPPATTTARQVAARAKQKTSGKRIVVVTPAKSLDSRWHKATPKKAVAKKAESSTSPSLGVHVISVADPETSPRKTTSTTPKLVSDFELERLANEWKARNRDPDDANAKISGPFLTTAAATAAPPKVIVVGAPNQATTTPGVVSQWGARATQYPPDHLTVPSPASTTTTGFHGHHGKNNVDSGAVSEETEASDSNSKDANVETSSLDNGVQANFPIVWKAVSQERMPTEEGDKYDQQVSLPWWWLAGSMKLTIQECRDVADILNDDEFAGALGSVAACAALRVRPAWKVHGKPKVVQLGPRGIILETMVQETDGTDQTIQLAIPFATATAHSFADVREAILNLVAASEAVTQFA